MGVAVGVGGNGEDVLVGLAVGVCVAAAKVRVAEGVGVNPAGIRVMAGSGAVVGATAVRPHADTNRTSSHQSRRKCTIGLPGFDDTHPHVV
jgi:hypothetical protein